MRFGIECLHRMCLSVLLMLSLSLTAGAQHSDTLTQKLRKLAPSTARVNALNEAAWDLRHNAPDSALGYAREAKRLADSLAYEEGHGWAWRNIGVIEYIRGNYQEAITAHINGLRIFEKLDDHEGMAAALNNIGLIHWELDHYEKAREYFIDAIALNPSPRLTAAAQSNLGLIHTELKNYAEALRCQREALEINNKIGDALAASTCLNNIGWVYELQRQYDAALREYRKCLQLRDSLGDKRRIASVCLSIGTVLRHKKQFEESLRSLDRAASVAREIGEKKILQESYQEMSSTYAAMGAFEKAFRMHVRSSEMKDLLLDESKAREVAKVEASFQLEQAEREVELLRRTGKLNETITYVISGVLLLVIAFTVVTVLGYRSKVRINRRLLETQQQLILQGKMASLGQLTAGIAHEIRNPLNFIKNFSELSKELLEELVESKDDAEEFDDIHNRLRQNIGKIHEHGNRADAIVRGMMLHARSSSEQRQSTDINAVVGNAVELASHGTKAMQSVARPVFDAQLDPGLPKINVVPQDISQVLLNIMNNAVDALAERSHQLPAGEFTPRISVTTSTSSGAVVIRIRDNGPGVPAAIRHRIFEPFYTTKEAGKGTGLGLSISYEIIVQKYGGTMNVESENNVYTEFIISLPTS